jgi:hypothetical protein
MTVLDLMIKLQSMPPNMEVMIDHTAEGMQMFKFTGITDCYQVKEGATETDIVIISPHEYDL